MTNKHQFHGELGYFLRYIQNLIKSEDELRLEIREIIIFGNKSPRRINGIKNHSIWIRYLWRNQGAESREKI